MAVRKRQALPPRVLIQAHRHRVIQYNQGSGTTALLERKKKMFPLRDEVWGVFLRGLVYGFLAGIVLIVLFLRSGKYGGLVAGKPIGFVYFLAGLEVGIALIGTIV